MAGERHTLYFWGSRHLACRPPLWVFGGMVFEGGFEGLRYGGAGFGVGVDSVNKRAWQINFDGYKNVG